MASPEVHHTPTSHRPTSDSPTSEPDWTDQVTDLVVDLVDTVRDKTTGPVLKGARGVVYGTVAFFVVVVAGIVGLALGGRALALLPIGEWLSYLILGVLFTGVGFIFWSKRHPV